LRLRTNTGQAVRAAVWPRTFLFALASWMLDEAALG